jgi:hypothetical protein
MTIANIPMLYHFTDRRNIASIRELGGLYSLDIQLIAKRDPELSF